MKYIAFLILLVSAQSFAQEVPEMLSLGEIHSSQEKPNTLMLRRILFINKSKTVYYPLALSGNLDMNEVRHFMDTACEKIGRIVDESVPMMNSFEFLRKGDSYLTSVAGVARTVRSDNSVRVLSQINCIKI